MRYLEMMSISPKICLILLMIGYAFTSSSQVRIEVKSELMEMGESESSVLALEVPLKLKSIRVDRTNERLYGIFSEYNPVSNLYEVSLLAIDILSNRVLWVKNYKVEPMLLNQSYAFDEEGNILIYGARTISKIDRSTAKEFWTIGLKNYRPNPSNTLVLADLPAGEIGVWDLRTGKRLWQLKMGWQNINQGLFLTDSLIYKLEDGITKLDLKSARYTNHEYEGINEFSSQWVDGDFPMGGSSQSNEVINAIIWGAFAPAVRKKRFGDSELPFNQVVKAPNRHYRVIPWGVLSLNSNAEIQWMTGVGHASKSWINLEQYESDLLFIDFGLRISNQGVLKPLSNARVLIIDQTNGEIKTKLVISEHILDYEIASDTLTLISNDNLRLFNLKNGEAISEITELNTKYPGLYLTEILGKDDYLKTNEGLISMADYKQGHYFFRNKAEKIVEFSPQLELVNIHRGTPFYSTRDLQGEFRILANQDGEQLLINSNLEILLSEELTPLEYINLEGLLIFPQEASTKIVDLKRL